LFCPSKVILERKELALLLSVVVSECASLEADITWLYATLMGKYLPHTQRKGPPYHPVGFLIFKAVSSTNQRTRLIMDLAKLLDLEENLMAEIKSVIRLIETAFNKRNDLAHAFWGIHDALYPDALISIQLGQKHTVYEKSDFDKAVEAILTASTAVHSCEDKIRNYLRKKKRPA
jgi:hypothetical protein